MALFTRNVGTAGETDKFGCAILDFGLFWELSPLLNPNDLALISMRLSSKLHLIQMLPHTGMKFQVDNNHR